MSKGQYSSTLRTLNYKTNKYSFLIFQVHDGNKRPAVSTFNPSLNHDHNLFYLDHHWGCFKSSPFWMGTIWSK